MAYVINIKINIYITKRYNKEYQRDRKMVFLGMKTERLGASLKLIKGLSEKDQYVRRMYFIMLLMWWSGSIGLIAGMFIASFW